MTLFSAPRLLSLVLPFSMLLKLTTCSPLKSGSADLPNTHHLHRRDAFDGDGIGTIIVVSIIVLMFIVAIIYTCGKCCRAANNANPHTITCEQANRTTYTYHTDTDGNLSRRRAQPYVCACAPGEGARRAVRGGNVPRFELQPQPDSSLRMDPATGRWETGGGSTAPVEVAPPPYSPPEAGTNVKVPGAAVVRPASQQPGWSQNGASVSVWRDGDGQTHSPEVQPRTGYWGRWAA